jgi:hypothetical protein
MDQEAFEKYLKERYERQLNFYDSKAIREKKKYTRTKWMLIILSAVTPVLISITGTNIYIQYATIVTSTLVAIITAAAETFKYHENWLNNRVYCERMKREKYLFDAGLNYYDEEFKKNAAFVKKVEQIIASETDEFFSINREQLENTKDKKVVGQP